MATDDKGLVLRGFFLLAVIGAIVAVVMAILFLRPQDTPPTTPIAPQADRLPSATGWEIRYNAATTLARRGSAATPWPLMREMLDEAQQMANARTSLPDGTSVINEAAARSNMIGALKALAVWHEKQGPKREATAELREIYKMVDKLAESPIDELKAQAEKARGTFFR
jgi:hypothetical protein